MDDFIKRVVEIWNRLNMPVKGVILAFAVWFFIVVIGFWNTVFLAVLLYIGYMWGKLKQEGKSLQEYLEEIGILKKSQKQ